MASSSPAVVAHGPETVVTIKVNFDGQNRRLKATLRDLGSSTLESKLRRELHIPSTTNVLFERYSDSAAAFVTLDPNNTAVYKQLYRAAKAKLKLRIKATVIPKMPPSSVKATVEDERPLAEALSRMSQLVLAEDKSTNSQQRKVEPLPIAKPTAATTPKSGQPSLAQLQRGVQHVQVSRACRESLLKDLDEIMSDVCTYKSSDAVPPLLRAPHDYFADLPSALLTLKAEKTPEVERTPLPENTKAGPPLSKCPYVLANGAFTVFCNHCSRPIDNVHYHCGICDEGDFDLCMDCSGKGMRCLDDSHWMIKRNIADGKVSCSTTEILTPKKSNNHGKSTLIQTEEEEDEDARRTCNSCIREYQEETFVTCTVCDDYDLCVSCHMALQHGHDPKHAFAPVVEDAKLDPLAYALLEPGRNAGHHAICDGCDKYIYGVRHKCLDCPDWDYCAACIVNASFIHPTHRFVPIYEPLGDIHESLKAHGNRVRHDGIYCDGPLCNVSSKKNSYIIGDRYKCAVCHDTDFCASCEASPSNQHNKTHPLIKFKTMIRNVSVTTMGDHVDGQRMKVMGDRIARNASKATETNRSANAATQVQTVADLKPLATPAEQIKPNREDIDDKVRAHEQTATAARQDLQVQELKKLATHFASQEAKPEVVESDVNVEVKTEIKAEPVEIKPVVVETPFYELKAQFVRDTIADGSVFPPNHVFKQTWTLLNSGSQVWPAGCSVRFVGGDNMCAIDPEHAASVRELASAAESDVCQKEVAPGQEAAFSVLMRTPSRPEKVISYWRLTGPTGLKFGHRLWTDVNVVAPVEEEASKVVSEATESQSGMVFPKLEKESPAASVHESAPVQGLGEQAEAEADDFAEFLEEGDEDLEDETDDCSITDEDYDILDASDEEYLVNQPKAAKK